MYNEKIKRISNYKVLKSAAGYYLGRTCEIVITDKRGKHVETYTDYYDRESGYYESREHVYLDNLSYFQ